jgi:RNA polymerase sigma-70 factor (ECF subfamily)
MTLGDSEFVGLLQKEGTSLASFVLALVGDRPTADDLYQATCLELWRLRETFRPGTDFGAWARTVARYQIRRHWRKASREKEKLIFSSEAVDRLAQAYAAAPPESRMERLRAALAACMELLAPEERTLLRRRYNHAVPVKVLATKTGRSEGGLKMALLRLRRKLARCVQARTAPEGAGDDD